MEASSRRILGLVSETNTRFVVPVYQRPYSWDADHCIQLWDDVLRCGRGRGATHFTGSVVTIRDGASSSADMTSVLLIDGQQRLTTIALMMMALARHVRVRPNADLPFSHDEIVHGGYLTNPFRGGDDHYKLTLSKGDRTTFQALVDAVEHGEDPHVDAPSRLIDNLRLLEERIASLDDVASVWHGLQRLEVVAIGLAQGADDPQVIFESMNATGKDLSVADLVRNFVLMSHPVAEQRELYRTYWRPLEETLGSDGFDEAFEGFIRCYLAIACAPVVFATDDAYRAFKRHVLLRGYVEGDRMRIFALRLRRFARYYVCATRGESDDAALAVALGRVARLGVDAATPLVVSLLDAYDHKAVSHDDLVAMLSVIESYLLRRAVCDGPASVLPTLFASLIARLGAVAAEGGDCAEALAAMLLAEEGTSRHFPSDAEFSHALRTRDAYHFRLAPFLLSRIEDTCSGGSDRGGPASRIVERILPPAALADDTWRGVLGNDAERTFEGHVNALGNLALTSYDFELQQASLADKQARLVGPGGNVAAIDADIVAATAWDASAIDARTERLATVALRTWPMPVAPTSALRSYRAVGDAAWTDTVSFQDLFEAGLVRMDDSLVSASPLYPGRATVTSRGRIMLANGESFDGPVEAYAALLASLGAREEGLDGWMYWRVGEGGPLIDDLRARLV